MITQKHSFNPFDAYLSVFEDFAPRSRPEVDLYWDVPFGKIEDQAGPLTSDADQ